MTKLLSLFAAFLAATTALTTGCASEEEQTDAEEGESALGSLAHTPIYSGSRTQSPITEAVARRLAALPREGTRADMFAKVGDSQTVNAGFMRCFARSEATDLGAFVRLEPTRRALLGAFDRESLSAKVGASASFALGGPLAAELAAIQPRYAVVMYGSNDIQNAPTGGLSTYARDMMKITDALLARGVVPILSSPPPRPLRSQDVAAFGPEGADAWVPRYASVVRGIAQARQVPFVDLARELRQIPGFGIGSDKLHLVAAPRGACRLDEGSLDYGLNVRNLVTLEALDRARTAAERGVALDDSAAELAGTGRLDAPFRVPELPFSDLRAPSESTEAGQACGARALFAYAVSLDRAQRVHVGLFGRGAKAFVRDASGACKAVPGGDAVVPFGAGRSEVVVTAATATSTGEHLVTLTPADAP